MSDAEILISFQPKGDDEVLQAIKTVTRHVGDLKKIAKAPIDLNIVKNAMRPADFERLKAVIDRAKEATRDLGKEAAQAAKEEAKLAAAAERAANAAMKAGSRIKSPLGGTGDSMLTPANFSPAAVDKARANLKNLNGELDKTKDKANGAGQGLGFVSRIIAAMAIRAVVREVFSLADSFTQLQNKIRTVTSDDSLGYISDQLFQIAQSSRTSLDSVVTAYTRTTRSVKALGKSQAEVLQFTETLSKAIQVGGSSAVEASNAMIQLSQGMGSGRLSGDELRSVLEQLPVVAQLIADEMGVATSALRGLGSAGKLTTEIVFNAINNATEEMNEKMKNMQLTVGQAWAMLRNQATMSSEAMQGTMHKLANAIMFVTNNFDAFVTAGRSVAQMIGVTLAAKAIGALIGGLTALKAAMATHPLTFWAVLAATVAAALQPLISQLRVASDSTATFGDVWSATWDVITERMSGDVKGGVEGIDKAVEGLSETAQKTLTIIATLIDKFIALTGIGFFIQKGITFWTDTNGSTYFADMVKDIALVTNQNAALTETNKLIKENQDLMAADMAQDGPGVSEEERIMKQFDKERDALLAYNKILEENEKKKKKESGKTLAEVLKEASFESELAGINDVDASIIKSMKSALDSLKPSIRNAIEAGSTLYDNELQQLHELIRMEESRKLYAEDRVKHEKEMNDLVDKRLADMLKEEELIKKIGEEYAESRGDRSVEREAGLQSTADSLDPNSGIRAEILKLQDFQKFADKNHLAAWAQEAKTAIDDLRLSMQLGGDHFKTFRDQMKSIFGPGGTLVTGFADAAANALVMSSSLKDLQRSIVDVLNSVQKQALSSLIQLPLNMAVGALGSAAGSGLNSSSLAGGGAQSVSASTASSWGLKSLDSGGYTGDKGIKEPAGIVHGQEFVLNATATRRMGKQNLETINKGGSVAQSSASPVQVTVNNNAGVIVETNTLTPGQVEIMISKAIQDKTGKVIAGQINDPNSMVSKSLSKNVDSSRRRV